MFSLVSPMLAIFHAQLMTEDCWEWFYLGISTPEMDLRGTTAVKLPGMKPAYNLISTIIQSAIRFLKCFQARRDNWWGNLVYSHFPQQNLLTLRKNINTCTTLFLKVYLHKKLINMSYYFYHHFHFLVVCSWAFICVEWLTAYISEIKQTSIRIVMISIGKDESQELNPISDSKTQFFPYRISYYKVLIEVSIHTCIFMNVWSRLLDRDLCTFPPFWRFVPIQQCSISF